MRELSRRDAAFLCAGAALLTVVLTWPVAPALSTAGRVDSSDARHGMWNVAWVAHALTTAPHRLFDANIFYPRPNTLAYSEANVVAGALAVPAWLATGDALTSFNWTTLVAFVLAAITAFRLVFALTRSVSIGCLGAILFAWSPYMFARLSHVQLLLTFGIPWCLLRLHRYVDQPTWGRAAGLGAVLALTALSSGYYGIFMAIALGWGFVWFGVPGRLKEPAFWAGGLLAAVVAAAIVLPFYLPYIGVREEGFARSLDEARRFSVSWRSYLASPSLVHEWLHPVLGSWRDVLFPGFIPLTLALVATVRLAGAQPRAVSVPRRVTGFYLTTAAWAVWLSLGPDASLYRWLYDLLPAFSWLRAPGRAGVLVTLSLVVVGCAVLADLLAGLARPRRIAATAVILASAVAGSYVGPIYRVERPRTLAAYERLAALPVGPVAELPYFVEPAERGRHTEYMLGSTVHWQPLLNGTSDHLPEDSWADGLRLADFPSRDAWETLERRGARYLVIHWGGFPRGREPFAVIEDLVNRGLLYRVVSRQHDGVSLYQILQWPHRRASPPPATVVARSAPPDTAGSPANED
jgi:hypothetical protein